MTGPVASGRPALASATGRPVDPDGLEVATAALGPAQVAIARHVARRHGRLIERDGPSLFGLGLAARLELPGGLAQPGAAAGATRLVAALGPDAVALGALPFDGAAAGQLAIPAVTVRVGGPQASGGRSAGTGAAPAEGLAVVVAPRGRAEAIAQGLARAGSGERFARALAEVVDQDLDDHQEDSGPPDTFRLSSVRPHDHFRDLVAGAVAAIAAGREGLEKVVLAREVEILANRPFRQDDLVERLRALHPSCATFAVDGFVGASPELLCARHGTTVRAVPLAGTVARSGDPDEDARLAAALVASEKERAEHALVVRAIVEDLAPLCRHVAADREPAVLELRNVAHLATTVAGELHGSPSALELAAALHPTPAVGGWPRPVALDYLARNEVLHRDRFAGPVGYLEGTGDGEWWLGIRSALVDGPRARLLAGVGIVAGSDPAAELAETQLKLQALLAVAVRP